MGVRGLLLLVFLWASVPAWGAEHPSLAKARALYNAGDFDAAITASAVAVADPASANAAALVMARSHLERYRLRADSADLTAARQTLSGVRAAALPPREQVDLLVGLGLALYLGDSFGAAAELFDTALNRKSLLAPRDQELLLDWWATTVDRQAQQLTADRRAPLFSRVLVRMEDELAQDPGNAPGNYWLAVAAHGAGDTERAWHASFAGWVRARFNPNAESLRSDLDRFVTQVLIPERARLRPSREQSDALAALHAEWDALKSQWN
jgi:hypothetical protein